MEKNRGRIKKLIALVVTTLGMAFALPGCGKDVQTPQEMSQNVAQLTDDFVTALQNGDIAEMKDIRGMVGKEKDKLLKKENELIDKGEDATAVIQQRALMENQESALGDVITKFVEDQGIIPKNSDLIGKIADGTGDAVGYVYDFLDGDLVYKTTEIVTEYAENVDNAYTDLANADKNLFKEWYGKNFDEVQAAKETEDPTQSSTIDNWLYQIGELGAHAVGVVEEGYNDARKAVQDENEKNRKAAEEAAKQQAEDTWKESLKVNSKSNSSNGHRGTGTVGIGDEEKESQNQK